MQGKVFSKEGMLFKEVLGGRLEMEKMLKFGSTTGFPGNYEILELAGGYQWRKAITKSEEKERKRERDISGK